MHGVECNRVGVSWWNSSRWAVRAVQRRFSYKPQFANTMSILMQVGISQFSWESHPSGIPLLWNSTPLGVPLPPGGVTGGSTLDLGGLLTVHVYEHVHLWIYIDSYFSLHKDAQLWILAEQLISEGQLCFVSLHPPHIVFVFIINLLKALSLVLAFNKFEIVHVWNHFGDVVLFSLERFLSFSSASHLKM